METSEKFTPNKELVTRKVYETMTELGRNQNGTYQIFKRRMLCYNKDGKIIDGTLRTDRPECSFFVNNKSSTYKNAKEIIVTKHSNGTGQEKLLFENPFEKVSDAQFAMSWSPMAAINSPFKTTYPYISSL